MALQVSADTRRARVKALLKPYGVPVVVERVVDSPEEAIDAARELGGRVAVKAESPQLLHKSDAGAVLLDLGPEEAASAFERVVAAAARATGDGDARAVVQRMAPAGGLEILVGLRHDPGFGPAVTLAMGGVLAEMMRDSVTEIAPLSRELALGMVGRLRAASVFSGFRGSPPLDVSAVADLLVAVGAFAVDSVGSVAELDLNPVMVYREGEGCLVVDGAAVLQPSEEAS